MKKIHPSWMVVMLALGIILGTILAVASGKSFVDSWIWLVVGGLAIGVALFLPARIMLILALFAGTIFAQYRASFDLNGQEIFKNMIGQTIEISGEIVEDPDSDDSKTALKLSGLEINEQKIAGTVYVQLPKNNLPKRSDKITLNGNLGEGFGTYAASMYRPEIKKIERAEHGDLLLEVRDKFADGIAQNIPEDEAKLGLAYLLGMKNGLSDSLNETLRVVGLVHIVVASGTHMSILVGFARKIFGKISRFAGLFFAMMLILAFGEIVGWTASITRAALVSGLSISMWYVGRKFEAWRLILLVMATTLLINPMFLINLGWILSFSSFGGILILEPIFVKWFYGDSKPNFAVETILTTITATIVCLPVSLYFFGTVSLISLVANLLILPTIPYVMLLIFLTGITSFLPFLAGFLGKIATFALDFHLFVVNFFGEQKMFLIEIPAENPWVFLLYIPIGVMVIYATIKTWKLKPKMNSSNTEKDWLMI